jgi:hypothetical protein
MTRLHDERHTHKLQEFSSYSVRIEIRVLIMVVNLSVINSGKHCNFVATVLFLEELLELKKIFAEEEEKRRS